MQDTPAKIDGRRTVSDSEPVLPGLYDQLIHLKDWKEETAEVCSAAEARYAVFTDSLNLSGFFLLSISLRLQNRVAIKWFSVSEHIQDLLGWHSILHRQYFGALQQRRQCYASQ